MRGRRFCFCEAERLSVSGPVVSRVSDFALLAAGVPALEVSGVWAVEAGGVKKRVK